MKTKFKKYGLTFEQEIDDNCRKCCGVYGVTIIHRLYEIYIWEQGANKKKLIKSAKAQLKDAILNAPNILKSCLENARNNSIAAEKSVKLFIKREKDLQKIINKNTELALHKILK